MQVNAHFTPKRILVFSMGEVIGDGLIKLPFIAGLRAALPESELNWCAAGGSTVYTTSLSRVLSGYVDRVITGAPGAGYDLVIDTQQHVLRSSQARLAGRRFVSGATLWRRAYGPRSWPEPLIGRLGALLDVAQPGAALRPLALTDAAALAAAEELLPAGPRYVGFAPGAGGAEKKWPLERYLDLSERAALGGATPVFFVGPEDAKVVALIQDRLPTALLPEWDRTDGHADVRGPLLVIALAARLSAAVANDAGPGHMLAAAGTPLLTLQKDRRKAVKFRPASPELEMLIAEDYGSEMAALPLDAAWAALQRLLDA